jgi:hypothetical protein
LEHLYGILKEINFLVPDGSPGFLLLAAKDHFSLNTAVVSGAWVVDIMVLSKSYFILHVRKIILYHGTKVLSRLVDAMIASTLFF